MSYNTIKYDLSWLTIVIDLCFVFSWTFFPDIATEIPLLMDIFAILISDHMVILYYQKWSDFLFTSYSTCEVYAKEMIQFGKNLIDVCLPISRYYTYIYIYIYIWLWIKYRYYNIILCSNHRYACKLRPNSRMAFLFLPLDCSRMVLYRCETFFQFSLSLCSRTSNTAIWVLLFEGSAVFASCTDH